MALQLAIRNKIKHPFNIAGKKWLTSFLKRHSNLSKTWTRTSFVRKEGFNKKNVNKFFDLLNAAFDRV